MAIDLPEDVPDAVRSTWDEFDGLHVPDLKEVAPEAQKIFKQGAKGRCMTCGTAHLGPETMLIVTLQGVNQIYCSHKCNQDMNVMGWIQQVYDDMKQAVDFRGKQ